MCVRLMGCWRQKNLYVLSFLWIFSCFLQSILSSQSGTCCWGIKNLVPSVRHGVKEQFCTQDGLAGPGPMEDRWKAPRTNSPAAEGEQHVTAPGRDAPGGRTRQTAKQPCQNHPQTTGAGKIILGE